MPLKQKLNVKVCTILCFLQTAGQWYTNHSLRKKYGIIFIDFSESVEHISVLMAGNLQPEAQLSHSHCPALHINQSSCCVNSVISPQGYNSTDENTLLECQSPFQWQWLLAAILYSKRCATGKMTMKVTKCHRKWLYSIGHTSLLISHL